MKLLIYFLKLSVDGLDLASSSRFFHALMVYGKKLFSYLPVLAKGVISVMLISLRLGMWADKYEGARDL